jgi:hypothetical protein
MCLKRILNSNHLIGCSLLIYINFDQFFKNTFRKDINSEHAIGSSHGGTTAGHVSRTVCQDFSQMLKLTHLFPT